MSVSYDQMSELTVAFQEAHVPPDRRRSQRIQERIAADITEWENDSPGRTFGVIIEDFSPTGVGMVHSGRLKIGRQYMLEIPRHNRPPTRVLLTVVRCEQVDGGMFSTHLEASEILIGRHAPRSRAPHAPFLICLLLLTLAVAAMYYLGFHH